GVGGRDTNFRKSGGLRDELLDRSFVDKPKRVPLLLDDAFELAKPLRRIILELRACIAKRAKVGFELTDRGRVAIGSDGPSFQNRRAEFGERDETFFEWTPVGHSTELLELLLQARDTLREAAVVRLQLRPVRAWYTNPSSDPTALPAWRTSRSTFRVEHIISSLTTSVTSVTWSSFHENVRLLMALEVKQ